MRLGGADGSRCWAPAWEVMASLCLRRLRLQPLPLLGRTRAYISAASSRNTRLGDGSRGQLTAALP